MLNFFSESVTITVAYMPGSTASGQFVKATLASRATAIILPLTKQFNQQLQEELNLPLEESIKLYDLYIQKFDEALKLFDGVENFLTMCNTR